MFKMFVLLLVIFFLVRFILKFLLPVIRVVRTTQMHMADMKKKMDHMQESKAAPQRPAKSVDGEYIEYEEVK